MKGLGPVLLLILSCEPRPVIELLWVSVSSLIRQIKFKVSLIAY